MRRLALSGIAVVAMSSAAALAQWTAVNLHPSGATLSRAYAGSGGRQGGVAQQSAALWSGSAASHFQLGSPVFGTTVVQGIDGDQQVGWLGTSQDPRAIMWSGTPASLVVLAPANSADSAALAAHDGEQVGYARVFNVPNSGVHAGLWHGTAASWVDLNPPTSGSSKAFGVYDGQQAGYAWLAEYSRPHAGIWSGTAASWHDLHPAVASESQALGIHAGQQVGYAIIDSDWHAGLWQGTSESWVDLAPAGSQWSAATSVHAGYQAGYAQFAGRNHAGIWSGTPDSWEDLGVLLEGSWTESRATAVWIHDDTLFVTGIGFNATTGREEALLWSRPVPAPGAGLVMILGAVAALRRRRPDTPSPTRC